MCLPILIPSSNCTHINLLLPQLQYFWKIKKCVAIGISKHHIFIPFRIYCSRVRALQAEDAFYGRLFFCRFCHWAELVSLKVQLCSKQINTVGLPVFPQNGPTFDITTTMSESTLLLFSFALTAFLMAPNVVFGQLPNGRSLPPIEGKLK